MTELFLLRREIGWCELVRDTTTVAGELLVPESTPEGAIPFLYNIAISSVLLVADQSIGIDGGLNGDILRFHQFLWPANGPETRIQS